MKNEQQFITVFVPSDNERNSCSRGLCGLLIIGVLVAGGYCFYEYGLPKIEAAINNQMNDFNEAVREIEKAFEPTVKAIDERTPAFIWPIENDGWASIRLRLSGGVSFFRDTNIEI